MKKELALNYLMAQMWALDQRTLSLMGAITSRGISTLDASDLEGLAPQALAEKDGKQITPIMSRREGVAVLNLTGVISRYAGMFDDICGGLSTEALAKSFAAARDDPKVKGIVLRCDGPGGDASGIHEMGEMIYQARGIKPIIAYVGGDCASALYWVASACDEVVVDRTAVLGSIGVVMTLARIKPTAEDKVERLEMVSSQSPNKRLDGFSEEGKAQNQIMVDQFGDVFIDCVARNMGLSKEVVLRDFGQGGVLIGQAAIDKGMAHRLGSFEGVLNELIKGKKTSMSDKKTTTPSTNHAVLTLPNVAALDTSLVIAALTEQRPDVVAGLNAPPLSALSAASDIAALCASKGVPALSATLLKDGVSKAQAEAQIKLASGLQDTLAAAGMKGSFEAMVGHLDDPLKLVGMAIHDAKAGADESNDQTHFVTNTEKTQASINSADIYANR